MPKQIRVSDEVYQYLLLIQQPRETFSEVVERMMRVYETIRNVSDILGPNHYLKERPIIDARAKETIDKRGNRPALPNVPIH